MFLGAYQLDPVDTIKASARQGRDRSQTTVDAYLDFKMKRKPVALLTARHRKIQRAIFSADEDCAADIQFELFKRYQGLMADREEGLRRKSSLENGEKSSMTGGNATAAAAGWVNSSAKLLTLMEKEVADIGMVLRKGHANDAEAEAFGARKKTTKAAVDGKPGSTLKGRKRRAFLLWLRESQQLADTRHVHSPRPLRYMKSSSTGSTGTKNADEVLMGARLRRRRLRLTARMHHWKGRGGLQKKGPPGGVLRRVSSGRVVRRVSFDRTVRKVSFGGVFRTVPSGAGSGGREENAQGGKKSEKARPTAFVRRYVSPWGSKRSRVGLDSTAAIASPESNTAATWTLFRTRRKMVRIRRVLRDFSPRGLPSQPRRKPVRIRRFLRTFSRIRMVRSDDAETVEAWKRGKAAWEDLAEGEWSEEEVSGEMHGEAKMDENDEEGRRRREEVFENVKGYSEGEPVEGRRGRR